MNEGKNIRAGGVFIKTYIYLVCLVAGSFQPLRFCFSAEKKEAIGLRKAVKGLKVFSASVRWHVS